MTGAVSILTTTIVAFKNLVAQEAFFARRLSPADHDREPQIDMAAAMTQAQGIAQEYNSFL